MRAERTHIAFRSSYNLAYEVTRKLDNSRDLFKDQDAYHVNETYLHATQEVINIYDYEASDKAFGVRDEFRVGGQTLLDIMDGLDDQVSLFQFVFPQIEIDIPSRSMTSCPPHPFFGSPQESGFHFSADGSKPFGQPK
jgi:hypothetical protein